MNLIKQNFNSLSDSENRKCQIIKGGDNIIYQITNAKNEKKLYCNTNNFLNNQNLTIIDLGKCEDELKEKYTLKFIGKLRGSAGNKLYLELI